MADARRAIESSADFTRGGTPPVPDHDATERQRAERIEAEQRRLVAWAKAHGKLGGRLPKDDVGGGEPVSVLTIDTVHQKSAPTNARIWRCLPA